jgi:hypothetical protein
VASAARELRNANGHLHDHIVGAWAFERGRGHPGDVAGDLIETVADRQLGIAIFAISWWPRTLSALERETRGFISMTMTRPLPPGRWRTGYCIPLQADPHGRMMSFASRCVILVFPVGERRARDGDRASPVCTPTGSIVLDGADDHRLSAVSASAPARIPAEDRLLGSTGGRALVQAIADDANEFLLGKCPIRALP